MKIHYVFAPTLYPLHHGDLGKGLDPPLGVLYLAAYLREYGAGPYEFKVTDGLLTGFDEALAEAEAWRADVLAVSIVTPNALGGYKLSEAFRKSNPDSKIVFGGPHATAFPDEPVLRGNADAVVVGEGEQTFLELTDLYRQNGHDVSALAAIDGLCFPEGDEIRTTSPRRFIRNLDAIPFPARDLVNMEQYSGWILSKSSKSTAILSSRGCPFHCVYCSNNVWRSSKPGYRTRSPENVLAEIKSLKQEYGIEEFFDNADEFNTSLQGAKALLRAVIDSGLDIRLQCQLRARPMDEELGRLLAKAGVWYVHLGIESGNQETLEGIKKKITLNEVEECCSILKRNGIMVWGLFMYFNIWEEDGRLRFEGVEESRRTLEFARHLHKRKLIDFFGGSITTPYPGSPLWDIARRHGLLKDEYEGQWDLWYYKRDLRLVSMLPGISEVDIFKLHQSTIKYTAWQLLRHRLIQPKNWLINVIRGWYALKRQLLLTVRRLQSASSR